VSTTDEETISGDEVAGLLAACTEAGRLKRAVPLAAKVVFLPGDGELILAAVAKYNVVIDVAARCIQHGCRDFRSQAPTRHLCKHVAATILALEGPLARRIAEELAECAAAPETGVVVPWRFEVITRFTPGG
jgi:hypothetical protein